MTEAHLKDKCMKALKEHGGFALKVHGGLYQKRGIPDILYWFNGRSFAIELKLPQDLHPLSKLQERQLILMNRQNVITGVARTLEEFISIIETETGNFP